MIDYHIHTLLCNHATQPMEAYIRRAIELGFKEICFLDHLIFGENGKHNTMTTEEVGLYFQAVQYQKHQFKKTIKIKAGLEVDYNPAFLDQIQEVINRFSFDVIGSSVHFVKGRNIVSGRAVKKQTPIDFEDLLASYISQLNNMLDQDYFDVVCHLDVVKKFTQTIPDRLHEKYDEILSKISYKNLTVEINTSGYLHPVNDIYPDLSLLKGAVKRIFI